MSDIKYPDITVRLVGLDGNAGAIMSRVSQALKRNGIPKEEIAKYREESISGDYNNLLMVAMKWVDVG